MGFWLMIGRLSHGSGREKWWERDRGFDEEEDEE